MLFGEGIKLPEHQLEEQFRCLCWVFPDVAPDKGEGCFSCHHLGAPVDEQHKSNATHLCADQPASTTRAPASICGTASEMPQRFFSCHCRTSRSPPPASARAVKVVNMIGLHDGCYHHRGPKVLSFGTGWAVPSSTQLAEYPDTLSSSVSRLAG